MRLNRAIAVAELDGPEVALGEVDGLPLDGYHAFHATRADLLRRLGRSQESRAAYDRAIALAGNTAETAYLTRRRDQLAESGLAGFRASGDLPAVGQHGEGIGDQQDACAPGEGDPDGAAGGLPG